MKVALTERAQREQDAIFDYIADRSASGARNVSAAIEQSMALIGDHPEIGEQTRRPHVRSLLVASYPYRLFYRTLPDRILILHIRHAARRPWLG